jgi:hypothetical protein
LLFVVSVLSVIGDDLDSRLSQTLADFPGFLRALFLAAFWGGVVWAVILLVVTLVRRRPQLALECLGAVVLALASAACVAAIVGRSAGDVFSRLGDVDGPPLFPPTLIAATSAVLAPCCAAAHAAVSARRAQVRRRAVRRRAVPRCVARHRRDRFGAARPPRWDNAPFDLRLAGGFPTVSRVRLALGDLGVDVADLHAVSKGREGSTLLAGTDAAGPLLVKVYGNGAWDGEALASAWRLEWYRGAQRTRSRRATMSNEGFSRRSLARRWPEAARQLRASCLTAIA